MSKISNSLAVMLCILSAVTAEGQDSTYYFTVQTLGGYTTPGVVPFWVRSNQFGSIPLDGASLSFIGAARKDYDLSSDKLIDWGASFEGRANLGAGSNLTLIEGYGKVRLGIFELRAGRSKKITGLCDTTLSSGSYAISGTNLGVPEVEVSVRDFWTIPWFGQLFAFKGNYSHGWLGNHLMRTYEGDTLFLNTFLHQKTLYGRFGKPTWRLKFYGGFNHQVVWGNEQTFYNEDYTLKPIETYLYVITGKRYNGANIQQERQGNHLGSIDIGLEYQFENVKVLLYRQNIYETGGLAHLSNIEDGLNGISIENSHVKKPHGFYFSKVLLEFLYTKKQSKGSWSPYPGEVYFESYFNHGQYLEGWSYYGSILGTPFIGTGEFIRKELATDPRDYFINNRVMVIHFGGEGSISNLKYLFKLTWSNNYGTYLTADPEDEGLGIEEAGEYGVFGKQKQLTTYLEINKGFSNGINLGLLAAMDIGELYYNSFGFFFKASYSFSL